MLNYYKTVKRVITLWAHLLGQEKKMCGSGYPINPKFYPLP